ncbi:MAG: hypothetical protein JXR94_03035 [Candidatus Hydrogenedentes bacterium]|nr:hypothetical protein [Candidatus Hydrogenedentota bacterium]
MNFTEVLNSPPMVHAAIVHIPLGLAVLGVPVVIFGVLATGKQPALRWLLVLWYVALVACAFATVETGEGAAGAVPDSASGEVWDLIEEHEHMGEKLWLFALATAIVLVPATAKSVGVRRTGVTLGIAASLATAGWASFTGHHGGLLVYGHGVGTPGFAVAAEEPAPAPFPAEPAPAPAVEAPADTFTPAIRPFTDEEAAQVSYTRDVAPILEAQCAACHRPGAAADGVDVTTVGALVAPREGHEGVVAPGKPDESELVLYIRGIRRPQMPKGREELSEDELHVLRMWIAAGAKDDSPA